ncbi:MAG: hypothetical protein M1608_15860, partial [Candidatus Omnitrophica bacterium]|nr:hypothetical protein [Candidatus Omnitrophota bacterium]
TGAQRVLIKRSASSLDEDRIWGVIMPNVAVNPVNNNLYLVYHDKPPGVSSDHANIYFIQSSDGGDNWSPSPMQVNSDGTTTDQWQPAITVKPDGSKLFIAWYDRRNDTTSNSCIKVYGVIAGLPITSASNFSTNFPISTLQFPPVFTGLVNHNQGEFDPCYPPAVRRDGQTCPTFYGAYAGYMGDYDIAYSDNQYVYFTWGDNRDFTVATYIQRNQANVRFVRLTWPR